MIGLQSQERTSVSDCFQFHDQGNLQGKYKKIYHQDDHVNIPEELYSTHECLRSHEQMHTQINQPESYRSY